MNIYLISQTRNTGYDTFDSAVVVAASEEEARKADVANVAGTEYSPETFGWASPEFVAAKFLGFAAPHVEAGIVLASFNAG